MNPRDAYYAQAAGLFWQLRRHEFHAYEFQKWAKLYREYPLVMPFDLARSIEFDDKDRYIDLMCTLSARFGSTWEE